MSTARPATATLDRLIQLSMISPFRGRFPIFDPRRFGVPPARRRYRFESVAWRRSCRQALARLLSGRTAGAGQLRVARSAAMARHPADTVSVLTYRTGIQDANLAGNVHGGWVMKLCDDVAVIAATRLAGGRVVTAAVDAMKFRAPVKVGDVITLRATVNAAWRTSMEVGVRVEAEHVPTGAGGAHLHRLRDPGLLGGGREARRAARRRAADSRRRAPPPRRQPPPRAPARRLALSILRRSPVRIPWALASVCRKTRVRA